MLLKTIFGALVRVLAPVAERIGDRVEEIASTFLRDMTPEQVEAKLSALAVGDKAELAWRTSIVDLMKLLDLDSSPGARAELAVDVGIENYHRAADQNIALHAKVLELLAERDIKLPKREA
jgi:hypothetical protein